MNDGQSWWEIASNMKRKTELRKKLKNLEENNWKWRHEEEYFASEKLRKIMRDMKSKSWGWCNKRKKNLQKKDWRFQMKLIETKLWRKSGSKTENDQSERQQWLSKDWWEITLKKNKQLNIDVESLMQERKFEGSLILKYKTANRSLRTLIMKEKWMKCEFWCDQLKTKLRIYYCAESCYEI